MLGLNCAYWHVMGLEGFCHLLQGFGVYRFANKYGANVDGYSPIYTPDAWAETGSQYSLGVKGLIAWLAALHNIFCDLVGQDLSIWTCPPSGLTY